MDSRLKRALLLGAATQMTILGAIVVINCDQSSSGPGGADAGFDGGLFDGSLFDTYPFEASTFDASRGLDSASGSDGGDTDAGGGDGGCPGVETEAGCNPIPLVNRTSGTSEDLHTVATAGATAVGGVAYIAGGERGTFLTTPDGESWTVHALASPLASDAIQSLAIGASATNKFVAVVTSIYGVGGSVASSPDADTWTQATGTGAPANAIDVVWTGTQYVSIGTGGEFATSPDGATWTLQMQSALSEFYPSQSVWTGSLIVSVGSVSNGPAVVTSPDGTVWTSQAGITSATTQSLWAVAAGNATVLATGNGTASTPGAILTSTDGAETWSQHTGTSEAAVYFAAGYTAPYWILLGAGAGVYSTDGMTWQPVSVVTNASIESLVTGGPLQMVSVGATGTIMTTTH